MSTETTHRQFLTEERSFAVLASAVILPGVGQLMQKRWIAGILFLVIFCLSAGLMLHAILHPAIANFLQVFKASPDLVPVPWGRIWIHVGLTVLIYFLNFVDAWRASRRDRPA